MTFDTSAAGAAAPATPEELFLASYLEDIGDEIAPERFQTYLDEIERIAPPDVFATLRRAAAALKEARAEVDRAVRQLPAGPLLHA